MRCCLFACVLLLAAATTLAEGPTREDLSQVVGSKGLSFIPSPRHPDAGRGYILRLRDGSLATMPKPPEGQAATPQWLVETMRKQKTGDLMYMTNANKTPILLVVSGHVRDLGQTYLFQQNDKQLEKPGPWPPADNAAKISITGWIVNPPEGQCYLIETIDGHYALLRVVARGEGGMHVQWLAGANTQFRIPGGLTRDAKDLLVDMPQYATTLPRPAATTLPRLATTTPARAPQTMPAAAATTSPAPVPVRDRPVESKNSLLPRNPTVLVPYLSTWLQQRDMLIFRRMQRIQQPPRKVSDYREIADAMADLGEIRAFEAAETLAANVSFMDATAANDKDPMAVHPAVGALIKLGKPGTNACLKALHVLQPSANMQDAPTYRTLLLAHVIRGIEGLDVAELILKREAARADDNHKAYFEQALRNIQGK